MFLWQTAQRKGTEKMSQTLTTDLILTEKLCTKAVYPLTAPLGLGSVTLNETTAPGFSFRAWMCPLPQGLALRLTRSHAHAAQISAGCSDPSLCLRTK